MNLKQATNRGGDNYAATEYEDPEPGGTRIPAGFSIDPY